MQTYYCKDGCCNIKIKKYKHIPKKYNKHTRKAGVFIYDPQEERVLLVQSRGNFWGPPKGTIEIGEQDEECAVREVKEETGLDISADNFIQSVKIKNKAICYYLEMNTCNIDVQDTMVDNDANGITWIKIKCLENAISNGNIVLNQYAKTVFNMFMKKKIQKYNFYIQILLYK